MSQIILYLIVDEMVSVRAVKIQIFLYMEYNKRITE